MKRKIGIDITPYLDEVKTGVGRYAKKIKEHFSSYEEVVFLFRLSRYKKREKNMLPILPPLKFSVFHSLDGRLPYYRISPKRILTIHDMMPFIFPHEFPEKERKKLQKAIKKAEIIISVSNTTKKDITSFVGREENIYVIYPGVEETFFPDPDPQILNKYQIKKDYILFVSTISKRKNIPTLIEAMKRFPELQLVLVGDIYPPDWESIKRKIEELPKKQVRILGYIKEEDLRKLYSMAKLSVYPSFYEGFGFPILESMACGTPVIASRIPSSKEIAGDAVLYFSPTSSEELEKNIRKLLNAPSLRKDLIQKGRRRIKNFSWDKTCREIEKLYFS